MTDLKPSRLFIKGQFVQAKSSAAFPSHNPATEEVLTEIQDGGADDIDDAVHAAKEALTGPWASFDPQRRQNCLWRLGDLIQKHVEEIALLETLDTGKTLFDSGKIEIPLAGEIFKYFAGWSTKTHGSTLNSPGSLKYTLREPVGVCGLIVPWNFPLLMASWKIAPALAMGNTVVLKPAELTSLSALKLAELTLEAGIPEGVFNVVTGRGAIAGDALVRHPDVDKISFTGSTEVGKTVMRRAADTLKRVTLELGGKSPNIIFADADLKAAIRGALTGIFYNKGEVCAAGSRLFVERSIYPSVLEQLSAAASKLTLGDPREKTTRMGPLVSQTQMERVLNYIEVGKREGAKLLTGGNRASHVCGGKGYFVEPTIFCDVDNEMTIAQQEIFGPVLAVIPFDSPEEALLKANTSNYGLAAGVWTQDVKKALRMAHGLKAGTIWVNAYNLYDAALPFGGYKESGFGRDLGQAALEQYTETKSIWIDLQ